ncbi:hypothetical protein Tco_0551224 [Tanacetum coccineum]
MKKAREVVFTIHSSSPNLPSSKSKGKWQLMIWLYDSSTKVQAGRVRRHERLSLPRPHKKGHAYIGIETQEKNSADTEVLLEEETPTELIEDLGSGEKGEKEISTADVPVSTAGAEVSTASHDVSTAAATLLYIRRSASKAKDK